MSTVRPAPTMTPLTPAEEIQLAEDEAIIEAGIVTFYRVGMALARIRDQRTYRQDYATFEEYVDKRWAMSRTRAYQLIESGEVVAAVSTIVDTPQIENEGQARALAPVVKQDGPEAGAAVLKEIEGEGEKVTAKAIAAKVKTKVTPKVKSKLAVKPKRKVPEINWSDAERALVDKLKAGQTVVVNMHHEAHKRLWRWAEREGLATRIDRKTEWGNPFEIPGDGDRDTVIRNYVDHYWPHKPSLHDKVASLRGRVLGCWCAPAPCHGDHLLRMAES